LNNQIILEFSILQFHSSAINITYTEQEKEDPPKRASLLQRRDSIKEQAAANRLSVQLPVQAGNGEAQSGGYESAGSAGKAHLMRKVEIHNVETHHRSCVGQNIETVEIQVGMGIMLG
jgi:hypothetical protein